MSVELPTAPQDLPVTERRLIAPSGEQVTLLEVWRLSTSSAPSYLL